MHKLRCIFAMLFAILIASPACCCLAATQSVQQVSHSCCNGERIPDDPSPEKICACSTGQPKIAEAGKPVPAAPVLDLPPLLEALTGLLIPPLEAAVWPLPPIADTGPQRHRLSVLQRFQI